MSPAKRLLLSVAVITPFLHAEAVRAQAIEQGWAGIAGGDWSTNVAYPTALEACQSMQNSVVPSFGHMVYGLLSVTPRPGVYNPFSGAQAPAVDCQYDAGPNGIDTIRDFYGCSQGKYVSGVCLPEGYPVTAEPCDCGAKGIPGMFPSAGDPVSLASGAKVEEVTDYSSGGPYPIEIKREYRSLNMPRDAESAGFGLAWRGDVVGRKIKIEWSGQNFTVSREDGMQSRFVNVDNIPVGSDWTPTSVEVWYENGTEYVQGQSEVRDRFYIENPYYVYQDENDRRDYFSGRKLVKSVWRGGYQRNYAYAPDDSNGAHPIQISDSLGRVVNITWVGNLISEVDLPDGTRLQYTYQDYASTTDVPSASVLTQVSRLKADGTPIDSTSYEYEAPRPGTQVPLLARVIDAAGRVIDTTTYDEIGRVQTAQGPGGANAVSIAYDDATNTRTVTNALGQVEVYTFAKSGLHYYGDPDTSLLRMTSVARQASPTVPAASKSLAYDFGDYVKTDWNGIVTRLTYDDLTNETSRIEDDNGLKRTITTTWSPSFHLPTQIVSPNLTVNFTYDTAGNLTKREEIDTSNSRKPVSRAWNYTYNPLGLVTSVTGPRTDVTQTTSYTYDTNGNLQTVTDALNHVTTVNSVNASGLPTSVTDQNGVVTLMTYDPLGRISTVSVQGPTPATTTFGYDVNGLLTSMQSPNGVTLTYGYDDAHRLMSMSDSQGNRMVFALDGLGNRIQTQVQTGTAQVLMNNIASFDSLGRLLTSIGAANQTSRYEYDNNGNQTKLTDPRNAVTQSAFDAFNRLKQTTDALNGVTQLTYDGQDNVTSVTDPKLHATTYTVNGWGFVTEVDSPDSGTTSYTYDLAGNVRTRTDARRIVTNYTYDALDRPLTRTYPATAENVTYGYDSTANGNFGVGRLTSVTDAAGTASFTYDAYGNRVSEMRTIGGINYTTAYEYDPGGNVTRITYPSGLIVTYQRDGLGQVSGVTMQANAAAQPVTLASNISYLPFGPMQSATLGNGVQLTNSYDLDYRLARSQAVGSASLQDLTLGYDGADNISSIADAVSPSLSQTFQYDLLGRVTQGVGTYGTDNYTYDAVGNRLTRSLVKSGATTNTTYSYASSNNQLTSAATGSTTLSYSYDARGARTAFKTGKTTTTSYTYNNDARLATAGSASMKYNAFGERSVEAAGTGGTHFIFGSDGALLAEYTTGGSLTRSYIYLNGQPLALVDPTGTVSYVLNDQVGQPQKMLNGSGAVTWQRVAGIFGDTVSQPVGTTSSNPLRFPGQWYDASTSLHYNYLRDYDPATGRYLETDPIGLDGGINPYLYADGNAVVYIDPFGLCWYYSQSTGKLSHVNAQGKVDYSKTGGYSGAGKGKNNPAMQYVPNVGPIPQGTYDIGTPYNSKKTGPFSLPLAPAPSNNMQGRKDFLMHGDNKTHTASEGCIIFPRDVRDTVNKSKDKCLKVTP